MVTKNREIAVLALLIICLSAVAGAGCAGKNAPTTSPGQATLARPAATLQDPHLAELHRTDVGILVRIDDKSIVDTSSLRGRRVASFGVEYSGATKAASMQEAVKMLVDGQADAVVGDYNSLYEYVVANPKIIKFAPNMFK